MNDKTVIYKTYSNIYDATYTREILKENGIESFVSEETAFPLNTLFSDDGCWGIKLHIFEKDFDRIEQILNNTEK